MTFLPLEHTHTYILYIYYIYIIMKTMCLSGYHHNGFMATHALGHMMYGLAWNFIFLIEITFKLIIILNKEF